MAERRITADGRILERDASGAIRVVGRTGGGVTLPAPAKTQYEAPQAQANLGKTQAEIDAIRQRNTIAAEELALKQQQFAASQKQRKFTPAQLAADKAFGQDYADWQAGGGAPAAIGQLRLLSKQIPRMKGSDWVSGPVIGALPDPVRKRVSPESRDVQRNVEKSVQATLRQTLGAQYTQKEGQDLLARTFDPGLEESDNIESVGATARDLRNQIITRQSAADFFEKHGTIAGWSPPPLPAAGEDGNAYARRVGLQRLQQEIKARNLSPAEQKRAMALFNERMNARQKKPKTATSSASDTVDWNDLP